MSELFVMVSKYQDLDAYSVHPINGKGPMHIV